ncbi:MAG: threonine aldolase family protein, partial [Stellaceae bacterium]
MTLTDPAIDLRSDTVTRPSPAMRAAMAAAPVGDDQYGEDPSVNRLQERIARLLGKEAALFVPSGTMANQIALKVLTRPGDEVVVGEEAHMMWHEAGAAAANSGVQFCVAGKGGCFTIAEFRAAAKPRLHIVFPPTGLVAIENTHNLGGGIVWPQEAAEAICGAAREAGIASYLDGARLCNASVASGRALADLAAPFDLASVALSKGLGCPVGSVLAGSRGLIAEAVT